MMSVTHCLPPSESRKSSSSLLPWKKFSTNTAGQSVCLPSNSCGRPFPYVLSRLSFSPHPPLQRRAACCCRKPLHRQIRFSNGCRRRNISLSFRSAEPVRSLHGWSAVLPQSGSPLHWKRVAAAVHTKGQAAVRYFPVVSANGS